MRPLAERILDPSQIGLLSSESFFDETLFHELSHSLGPAFVKDSKNREVRVALESSHAAIEECKADVMGAYNILYLVDRGDLPKDLHDKLLVSYFAGLFRSTRFGVAEAHGQGAAVQINRYLEEGAARFDAGTKKYTVDLPKLEAVDRQAGARSLRARVDGRQGRGGRAARQVRDDERDDEGSVRAGRRCPGGRAARSTRWRERAHRSVQWPRRDTVVPGTREESDA